MPTLLEIVAPDRLLLSQPVDMAVIPAARRVRWACCQGHSADDRAAARRHHHVARGRQADGATLRQRRLLPRSRRSAAPCWPTRRPRSRKSPRRPAEERLKQAEADYAAVDKTNVPATRCRIAGAHPVGARHDRGSRRTHNASCVTLKCDVHAFNARMTVTLQGHSRGRCADCKKSVMKHWTLD